MSDKTSSDAERHPCGLYRTTRPIGDDISAGTLVYYHNHGDPGPGVYLPRSWKNNRAIFHERGQTIPDLEYADSLEPLLEEGFYRVVNPFHCCEEECQHFEEDLLVQLGYNGSGEPILFMPELIDGALALPSTGAKVEEERLTRISPLKVPVGKAPQSDLN